MKIKKFVATDMQQAMQQIRRELGEDAVIINTAREPVRSLRQLFGPRKIEVTAAVDDIPVHYPPPPKAIEPPEQPPLVNAGTVRTRPEAVHPPGHTPATPRRIIPGSIVPAKLPDPIVAISGDRENNWFRIILRQEMDKEDAGLGSGVVDKWKKILRQMEVNDAIIDILFKDFTSNPEQEQFSSDDIFRVHLKARIVELVKHAYNKENKARVNTFIGPTGVGKTLTLAKLATRLKVVENKQIAMITVFNHRFGAVEKLNFYGDIIGVPVEVVMTPAELARAVESHRDKDVVFIDTEGRPSLNKSQVLELHSFTGAVTEPQNILLVLSTPTKNRDLVRIANDFRPVGYNGIIMTKLDETDTYGSMLNLVCNTGVPVTYVTNGQNVPDDIDKITPKRLAEIILGGVVLDEDY
jgi:flagellar biosynthesis protein FlhF